MIRPEGRAVRTAICDLTSKDWRSISAASRPGSRDVFSHHPSPPM